MTSPARSDEVGSVTEPLSKWPGRPGLRSYEVYNVFLRRRQPWLRCAIRVDHPVPTFIVARYWDFYQTVRADAIPVDFEPRAARQGSDMLGYYLFDALRE